MPLATGDKIKEEEINTKKRRRKKKKFPFNPKSSLLNIAIWHEWFTWWVSKQPPDLTLCVKLQQVETNNRKEQMNKCIACEGNVHRFFLFLIFSEPSLWCWCWFSNKWSHEGWDYNSLPMASSVSRCLRTAASLEGPVMDNGAGSGGWDMVSRRVLSSPSRVGVRPPPRISTQALLFPAAESCAQTWCRSPHARKVHVDHHWLPEAHSRIPPSSTSGNCPGQPSTRGCYPCPSEESPETWLPYSSQLHHNSAASR